MKSLELKIVAIGNSKGIRLPAEVIQRYGLEKTIILEQRPDELAFRPKKTKKLGWKETYQQMAAANEDWSDLECTAGDGLE